MDVLRVIHFLSEAAVALPGNIGLTCRVWSQANTNGQRNEFLIKSSKIAITAVWLVVACVGSTNEPRCQNGLDIAEATTSTHFVTTGCLNQRK